MTRTAFGRLPDGRPIEVLRVASAGVEVEAISYGGIITSLSVPDRAGELADVVLGYDDLAGYLAGSSYFGAIIGRYANRIAKGRFSIDGQAYRLATNNGENHLHGGVQGFDKVAWRAQPFEDESGVGVAFSYTSRDGEEGYPGSLGVRVTYTLTPHAELAIEYSAVTDKPTPVNLSHHSYFNLAGEGARDVLDHVLTIHADRLTAIDGGLIPTGVLAPVEGTAFDFRTPTAIGARIGDGHEQLRHGRGYDHTFVLSRSGAGLFHAARLFQPSSGRVLDVHTTEPGLQLYTGNFLDGIAGKAGHSYGRRSGLCLETQHFPDSPNQPGFPSTLLRPGQEYRSKTVYAFGLLR